MNWAYIHLLINHFPMALSVVGVAGVLAALATRRRTAWLFALATLTLAGLSAYPVNFSGEEGEDAAEEITGVTRDAIHEHEEAGELALYLLLATGAAAAYGWWRLARAGTDGRMPAWLGAVVTLGALASAGATARTSYLGGHIIHGHNGLTGAPSVVAPAITGGVSGGGAIEGRESGEDTSGRGRR
jgi:hypothetical protein